MKNSTVTRTTKSPSRLLAYFGLAAMFALFVVWPVPHTMGVRNLVWFLSLIIFIYIFTSHGRKDWCQALKVPLTIYLVLSFWLLFVALFVTDETYWSLSEMKGQWLKGALAMLLGILVAANEGASPAFRRVNVLRLIGAALLLHVVFIDLNALYAWYASNKFPQRISGLMEHSAYANHVTNLFMILLMAETFLRLAVRKPTLPLSNKSLIFFLVVTLASAHFEMMRNGMMELLFVAIILMWLYWRVNRGKASINSATTLLITVAIVLIGYAYVIFYSNAHWQTFVQTVPIALDTEKHRAWLNPTIHKLPRMQDGTEVSHSNYMRLAWFKEGLKIVMERPLGVGYGRNAFGHAIEAKYGRRLGSSHSGLLDFAIGGGIPAALLWCGFLASIGWIAFKRYRDTKDYFSLALFLVIASFAFRMLLDGTIRDHIHEQFLFMVGLLAVWTVRPIKQDSTVRK